MHKMKGTVLDQMGGAALSVGLAVIVVSVVALILANMSTASTNTNFTYVMYKGQLAITSFADWFSIIVVVVVAVLIISLVLMLRGRGGEG